MTVVQSARPARRLSITRLFVVILGCAGVILGAAWWVMDAFAGRDATEATHTWFAPYVDVTLTPTFHFEDPYEQPASDVVLGFIVADSANECAPSWGTYYDLEGAARALDLDRRIVRLRERGGDVVVSFGGAINNELATVCRDVESLVAAYQSVIDRYQLTAVDFDIEGAALADSQANGRRAKAIQRLQQDNQGLQVWVTLPVAPHGLSQEALDLVEGLLREGVDLAGVNVMTMNYGGSRAESDSMAEASVAALNATWQQLSDLYARLGIPRTDEEIWGRIGATPMIGQNDVPADVFTPGDAQALLDFVRTNRIARVSFWSANRDVACGPGIDGAHVSNTCSGVNQSRLEFSRIFSGATPNTRADLSGAPAPQVATPGAEGSRSESADRLDPLASPYPIWRAARAYEAGAKVTWQGRVYEAKWWTQGDQPDAPVEHPWDTPWRYLGPVLESDREAVQATKPTVDGSWPRWAAERVYVAGDEVEHKGQVFRAKWWTQGVEPQEDPDQPYDHPWQYIGDVEKDREEP